MKKETKASKIMKYIASHPKSKARDVAKALKVSINSVYQATYLAKKEAKSNLSSVPRKRGRPFKLKTKLGTYTKKNQTNLTEVSDGQVHLVKELTSDAVNSPSHYKVGGIETIDYIEAKSLGYNLGNVVKYVSRADYKGRLLEDLKKARWYLCREINNLSK
jgi:hypothetical protein